jgi:hypothetical protein
VPRAQVFTGGVAPAGYSKVLWAFLDPSARGQAGEQLVVEARQRDGPGRRRDTFSAISHEGQEGAPSYVSSVELDRPGCCRLFLTTGDLRAHVDIEAVPMSSCRPARVHYSGDGPSIDGYFGLVGRLGFWPDSWRRYTRARVYTDGRAPGGAAAKVMWAFSPSSRWRLDRTYSGQSARRLETAATTHFGRRVSWVQVKRSTCHPATASITSRSRSDSKLEGER